MTQPTKTSPHPFKLDVADIQWRDGDIPTAKTYGDIYFSPTEGLQETQYVFLNHNQLAERWNQLHQHKHPVFSIGEIGFGTGLNFLATWQLWEQHAPANASLHFVSAEKHPLLLDDLKRSLDKWPELKPWAQQLLQAYPTLTPGQHLVQFNQGKINLHLLFGDATTCFEQLKVSPDATLASQYGHHFDAWYLDGFAPAKNPQLWDEQLLALISQLSKPGTTLATFTAAGYVRRSLISHGFDIEKVPGFKHKREMLRGVYSASSDQEEGLDNTISNINKSNETPWYVVPNSADTGNKITVIGAGLAGTSSAYALAKRGWDVTLIERHHTAGQEASGNSQGMLYTKLSTDPGKLNQFSLNSYLFALRHYRQLVNEQLILEDYYQFCGLLQLVGSQSKEHEHFQLLKTMLNNHPQLVQFVNADEASKISGIGIDDNAYFFPQAGWISPAHLCQRLSDHPNITKQFCNEAMSIEYLQPAGSDLSEWHVFNDKNTLLTQSSRVIIANSLDAMQFKQSSHLALKSIRGQISLLPVNETLARLSTVICHDGYITPPKQGKSCIGATFSIGDRDITEREQDHQQNLDKLYQAIPSVKNKPGIDISTLSGRAGLRCSTPDYLPVVGQLPVFDQFVRDYDRLRKDAKWPVPTTGAYHPGLYINTGHGSKGLTSTPLCAELLAALISNEPLCLPRQLVNALNPARFIIRDLIRKKL